MVCNRSNSVFRFCEETSIEVVYQTFRLTTKFVLELYVLWLYMTLINSEIFDCKK